MPAYNEAKNLGKTVPKVITALSELSTHFELVVVNDGSRDATEQILNELSAQFPQLLAINLSRNFG